MHCFQAVRRNPALISNTRLPTPETAFSLCAGISGNGGQVEIRREASHRDKQIQNPNFQMFKTSRFFVEYDFLCFGHLSLLATHGLIHFGLDFGPLKIYSFFMQSRRLARLLRMIVEVRTQPDKPPQQIAKDLGISTRQFYYDRNQLAQMGFRFSRAKERFTIHTDPVVTIEALPLSEVLALVLATRHLFATRDFSLVQRALKGLYKIVDHMPESQKQLLRSLIQDVIIKDGFGCSPDILEDIIRAVDEKTCALLLDDFE